MSEQRNRAASAMSPCRAGQPATRWLAPPFVATLVATLVCATSAAHAQHAHGTGVGHSAEDAHVMPTDGGAHRTHVDEPGAHRTHVDEPGAHREHAHDAHKDGPSIAPVTTADLEAAFPDLGGMDGSHTMLEDPFNSFVLLDQLETREADGGDRFGWELSAWMGRSLRRLWVRSEGERRGGDTEHAELELLWGRSVSRWWDIVGGARQEFEPGPARTWAAFGVQGLAPYRLHMEATAYVGEGGRTAARIEAAHELLLTNRLILQPLVEVEWHGRADTARAIGSGLTSAEAALRLRYEFRREIAPYIGVEHERKFGGTADLAEAAGDDSRETRLVAGIRIWF